MASQVVGDPAADPRRGSLHQFFVLGTIALWVAMLTAVASAFDYYRRFNHVLSEQAEEIGGLVNW